MTPNQSQLLATAHSSLAAAQQAVAASMALIEAAQAEKPTVIAVNRNLTDAILKDPRNKLPKSPTDSAPGVKFTARGRELLFRLFDADMNPHAAADKMSISDGGARHQYINWTKAGGKNRQPILIDIDGN